MAIYDHPYAFALAFRGGGGRIKAVARGED